MPLFRGEGARATLKVRALINGRSCSCLSERMRRTQSPSRSGFLPESPLPRNPAKWRTPAICMGWRPQNQEFGGDLGYIVNLKSVWAVGDPVSKSRVQRRTRDSVTCSDSQSCDWIQVKGAETGRPQELVAGRSNQGKPRITRTAVFLPHSSAALGCHLPLGGCAWQPQTLPTGNPGIFEYLPNFRTLSGIYFIIKF